MQIILPKKYLANKDHMHQRWYFLAGPIQGGGDWQTEMCQHIQRFDQDAIVACPCPWGDTHPLAECFTGFDDGRFKTQLDWERYYLELAGTSKLIGGCIIFWLPKESTEMPHPGPGPYARDTRGELGEWRMRMKYEKARVAIGGEKEFHGLDVIKRNFEAVLGEKFSIFPTIEWTARNAYFFACQS